MPFVPYDDTGNMIAIHEQGRRAYNAALAGASSLIVPPQEQPHHPQPVLSSGAAKTVAVEISVGQDQTVTVVPTASPDWPAVRAEMIGRIEAVEASFQKIAPFLAALEVAYGERSQLGHNYPPERIEMLPLDTIEVQVGTAVAKLARAELITDNPRSDVLRVCGLVLNQIAARAHACLSWIGTKGNDFVDACVKSAGTETGKRLVQAAVATELLNQLHIDLTAIVTQILHIFTHG